MIRQDVSNDMVEATGFEPAASCSQSKHSTKLSYASNGEKLTQYFDYSISFAICQVVFQKNCK